MDTLVRILKVSVVAVVVSLTLSLPAQAATYQTYVIHTYGGASLLPAVRQQLNNRDGGSASIYQDKLILQTSAANYQAVQQLLRQIDTQPQALTVAVRVGNTASAQGNINQGQIIITNRGVGGSGIISQSNRQQQSNSSYQVQTLSGSAASIGTNTLYSLVQNYQINSYPTYNRPAAQIIIRQQILLPTTQGIAVVPRLLANGQIEVQLSQAEERLVSTNSRYNQNSAIQGQRLNSTIIVPRGQWVTIGQINQNSQNQSSNYGGNSRQNSSTSVPIMLMVQ